MHLIGTPVTNERLAAIDIDPSCVAT